MSDRQENKSTPDIKNKDTFILKLWRRHFIIHDLNIFNGERLVYRDRMEKSIWIPQLKVTPEFEKWLWYVASPLVLALQEFNISCSQGEFSNALYPGAYLFFRLTHCNFVFTCCQFVTLCEITSINDVQWRNVYIVLVWVTEEQTENHSVASVQNTVSQALFSVLEFGNLEANHKPNQIFVVPSMIYPYKYINTKYRACTNSH